MNAQIDPNSQQSGRQTVDLPTSTLHARASFADEVRGTAPKEIDLSLARMAEDVYRSDDRQRAGVEGWKPLSDEQFRQVGIDPTLRTSKSSGFDADVYGDGNGRYVLAFRGTDAGKDWATNLGQGLGFETAQYNQAVALSRQAKVAFGEELVMTGHSLGGGLAAVAAVTTDSPAVTFNAAGVKDKTLERVGLDASAVKEEAAHGQIRRYAVDNEILTGLQERNLLTRNLMADAVGHKIQIPDPDPQTFWQGINPVKSVMHGVDNHMMDSVIRSQEMAFGRPISADTPMSDLRHPHNAGYQNVLKHVEAAEDRMGIPHSTPCTQNLAGALVAESLRTKVDPGKIDNVTIGGNGYTFATQSSCQESNKYAYVPTATGIETPLNDSSRQSVAPQHTNAQPVSLQHAPEPLMEQGAIARGGR
jgi:Protein of unknown function (DUF2974)